jgi:hypothetical protein
MDEQERSRRRGADYRNARVAIAGAQSSALSDLPRRAAPLRAVSVLHALSLIVRPGRLRLGSRARSHPAADATTSVDFLADLIDAIHPFD